MALSVGERLGPYQVLSAMGAGGMGEIYKARDTRLDRTVAIKVLPKHIAEREDLRARFEREARIVASLNHPNICTLHDIGDGYMVMELIEGDTLAARIEKGALPLEQALTYATQIADALDRAHRAGVTHRDVKPQNIMLTRDGVKVLDFGLAKSAAKPAPSEETLTEVLTTEGAVMGTPQYMAPEQFGGKEADARSDIWAFGAVLYEMVTGQRAFQGRNYTSLVAAILGGEPAPMAVKPFTPAALEALVRGCLNKDPEDRWQSMRDVLLLLKTPQREQPVVEAKSSRWPWALATATMAAFATLAFLHFSEAPVARPLTKWSFAPAELDTGSQPVAMSPDGRHIVYEAGHVAGGQAPLHTEVARMLWVRDIDRLEPSELAGTEGASRPFWSPDSRFIGFAAAGELRKISVQGGSAITLCSVTQFLGRLLESRR